MNAALRFLLVGLCATATVPLRASSSDEIALTAISQKPLQLVTAAPSRALAPPPHITAEDLREIAAAQKAPSSLLFYLVSAEDSDAYGQIMRTAGVSTSSKPHTTGLINLCVHDALVLGAREVLAYRILGPSIYSKDVKAIIPLFSSYAYPSLHTTNLHVALELLQLASGRSWPDLEDYISRVEQRRIAAGLEWPAAIAPSRLLAKIYVEKVFRAAPAFESHLALAQAEWKRAR